MIWVLLLLPRTPIKAGGVCRLVAVRVLGRREGLGLRGFDADDIEPINPVVLCPIVVLTECHVGGDDDACGKRLLQACDAELSQVALCHRQGSFAEPDIVPDNPVGVLAFHDDELRYWLRIGAS
jgi:hypothetical protein